MNPVQFGNPTTEYNQGYDFLAGKTYYFSASTRLIAGTYTAEPGAVLLFGPDVYLTLGKQACLTLEGATLTSTCDEQWGGIRVESYASISARNTDKTGRFYNEISHSQDGIALHEKGFTPNPACPVALDLDGVRFRHNFRSVRLFMEVYRNAGQNRIMNCIFEADPRQMLAPYAYQSPQRQWCSYAHLSLGGQALDVRLEGNTFRGALFGIWAPGASNVTATRNTFSDCYIAGAFNLSNAYAGTWNRNTFNLADPYNDFIYQDNDFVNAAYENLAALGNVPGEISTPGTAVGLCASGEPLTVDGNQFLQTLDRGDYTGENYTPQTGLWAGPGTALLRRNVFQNLYLGAAAQAQQPAGGVADGNTFTNCRVGLAFINRDANTPPGDVRLTCNTFVRPDDKEGDSFAIYLGPGPYVPGLAGRQVNIAEEPIPGTNNYIPILQNNRFVGVSPPYNPDDVRKYWHVYNDGGNASFDYTRYNASANSQTPTVVPNDATVTGDDSGSTNAVVLKMNVSVQYQPGVNDCVARNYPAGVGLRPAQPGNGPAVVPYYLTQNAPNPCAGSTSVSYRLPSRETGELVVRDTFSGRVWLRQALSAGERTVDLRLEKLPPGAYHYSLEANGRPVAHHQLLVQ